MIWTIIVILFILWLLGFLGPRYSAGFPRAGGIIHILLVIALILVILNLIGAL